MEVGIYGMGRMGFNMAHRLLDGGHRVVAGNRSPGKVDEAKKLGADGAYGLQEMVEALSPPRVLWSMLPAGEITDHVIGELASLAAEGDILVDGANSYFRDSIRRAKEVEAKGLRYLDAGISGGIWGYEVGYCTMVGGSSEAFTVVEPLLETLAPPDGYLHVGPHGAGHFVKMVHNGIEYGMLAAYAEGFEILEKSDYDLDLHGISHLWNQGSVVRSWLLELAESAFEKDARLENIAGYVEDSGEGRWTVQEAINEDVPAPIITGALFARFASRQDESFAAKVIAALRNEFGGHAVRSADRRTDGG